MKKKICKVAFLVVLVFMSSLTIMVNVRGASKVDTPVSKRGMQHRFSTSEDNNTKDVVDAVQSGFFESEIRGLPLESSDLGNMVNTILVETRLSDCSFQKMGMYDYVQVEGFETYTEPGKPQLPVKTFVLTLPKDSKVLQVEVAKREVIEIERELYIVPTPQPVRWTASHEGNISDGENISGREGFEPDESVYSLDTYFPSKAVSYDEGCDNENRQVFVRFFPIQYIPKAKKAYLITKAEISICYQARSSSRSQSRDDTESVTRTYPVDVENIVITPPSLFQQAETLKNFHNSDGLVSEVVNTTWIYENYVEAPDPPYDGYINSTLPGWSDITGYNYSLAKRIISFLNDSSEHPDLRFVTLFGNARLVPPSYYLYISHYNTYNNWIPADFFYGSPDYDVVPNYEFGRIPVNSTEEAEHVVSKIESWNNSISYDWFRNVVLGGGKPFGTIYYVGEMITTDSVNRESFTGMNITKRFHTGGDFDPEHLIDAFSGETGMLYIITHGSGYGIYPDGQALLVDELLALPSNSRVPVVVSIACEDGAFDTNVLYGGFNMSFGEGVLLSNASGIAYIGGSRVNYGAPYFFLDDGEVHITKEPFMAGMLTYVFEAYHNGTHSLGGITKAAIEKYVAVNSMSYTIDKVTLFEFCLLGDPALQLPPQQPGDAYVRPDLTAVDPEGYTSDDIPWYFNDTTITISSETDSPNITVRRLEVFDDQTVDLLDADTVGGWFNYTFEADVGMYLVRFASCDGKEGWIYVGAVPPLTGAQTLVVDDDQGANYEEYYQNAISACGYTYDRWVVHICGSPESSILGQYSMVVWLTGDSWNTLSWEDMETLTEYLDGGGRLFISGQDIGFDIGWTAFYETYLHANYVRDDTNIYTLEGVSGDPIGDGLNIGISGGDGADNQWFPSEIEPADFYACPVFRYTGDGYGAIWAYTGVYKVVYFAFGFEAINTSSNRDAVMERVLDFLEYTHAHELVVSLDAPNYLRPCNSSQLNATVYNLGLGTETNVELFLLVNGAEVNSTRIPELVNDTSYPINYLWTPTVEATYNVTVYAPPVPGENITANNIVTKMVNVRPVKEYILFDQTHGTDSIAYYSIWTANLTERGYVVENVTTGPITSDVLAGYGVFAIPQAYYYYSSDELSAIQDFVLAGGGLLVIGDDYPSIYTDLTSFAGITWASGGCSGSTSDITPHPVTEGVATAYFSSPISRLSVIDPAEDLIRDPCGNVMLAASEIGAGKVLGIADEHSIHDYYIGYADNFQLANNMIDWLLGPVQEWDVVLTATKEGYSDVSDFGVRSDATEGFDPAYDELDPPEPPVGVVSYFWYPDNPTTPVDLRKLSTSKIPPSTTMNWTYKVKPVSIDGLMCLSWSPEEIAVIPSEYSVCLGTSEGCIDMREVTQYCFTAEPDTTYTFTVKVVCGCDFKLNLWAGWNMVSFSCIPEDANLSSIFNGIWYQALTWNGSAYQTATIAEAGKGYWIAVLENTTVTITGGIPVESYQLDLPAGWSMIGSIITCTIDADCVFPGWYQLLTWDGTGYVPTTIIEPGKGYWACVLEETHIIVNGSCCTTSLSIHTTTSTSVQENPIKIASDGWDVHLTATKEGYSDISDFGVRSDATEGFDPDYDELDPPPPPAGVVSYFWYPNNPSSPVDLRRLSTSKIHQSSEMTWTYKLQAVAIDGTMCINWSATEIGQIPSEYSVRLLNAEGVIVANMREVTGYCFTAEPDITYTFTISVAQESVNIGLCEKWNLIGVPLEPHNRTIEAIFAENLTYVKVIYGYKNGSWYWYIPGFSPETNTLHSLEPGMGYWVAATEGFTITINGTVPDRPSMVDEWNLFSVVGIDPVLSEDYLVDYNWLVVYGWNCTSQSWMWNIKGVGGDLEILEPGSGYWVQLASASSTELMSESESIKAEQTSIDRSLVRTATSLVQLRPCELKSVAVHRKLYIHHIQNTTAS